MSGKQTSVTGPIAITTTSNNQISLGSSSPVVEAVYIHQIDITNSSAANANIAFGYQLTAGRYKVGLWSNANVYTDDTTDAQSSTAADVNLFTVNSNSAGFIVQTLEPINIIAVHTNTAPSGGSPAYSVQYWNGSAFANVTLFSSPAFTNANVNDIGFHAQLDAAPLVATDTFVSSGGLSAGYYAYKVVASTAPTSTRGTADQIRAIKLLDFVEDAPAGATAYRAYSQGLVIPYLCPIIAYVSPADSGNTCSIEYRKSA